MSKYAVQRGQTLPLVAIAILVLVGAVGFAVDVGYHQYRERLQQTATDSAAIAAGQELLAGNFVAAARRDAQSNGFTDQSVNGACDHAASTCVDVSNPPVAPDAYAGNTSAVEVSITSPNPTFFEKVFGINVVHISTKAVAVLVDSNSNECVVTLNGAANFNATTSGTANPTLNAPDCGLIFNGGANFNNASVDAASIECAATCSNAVSFTNPPVTTAPVSDPCPTISYCAYLTNDPPNCDVTPPITITNGSTTLQPGCYNSSNMKNLSNLKNVTLTCGLYIIQTTFNISATGNNPPVNISQPSCGTGGVTLYVDMGGSINFRNANINLSAPSSGDYSQDTAGEQNALFYQVAGNTNAAVLQSASCSTCSSNLSGMMYFPNANLNYNASNNTQSGTGVMIIAGSANFNGSLSNVLGAPGPGPLITKTAVLGE